MRGSQHNARAQELNYEEDENTWDMNEKNKIWWQIKNKPTRFEKEAQIKDTKAESNTTGTLMIALQCRREFLVLGEDGRKMGEVGVKLAASPVEDGP